MSILAWGQNYESGWTKIDQLIKKQQYATADQEAEQLWQQAREQHNSRQLATATYYRCRIGAAYQEDADDTSLARLTELLPLLDKEWQSVGHLLLAKFYMDVMEQNQYQYQHENKDSDDEDLPYALWSAQRMRDTIQAHLQAALQQRVWMKQQSADSLPHLLTEGEGVARGNLFDVAVAMQTQLVRTDLQGCTSWQGSIDAILGTLSEMANLQLPSLSAQADAERYDLLLCLHLLQEQARDNLQATAERQIYLDRWRHEQLSWLYGLLADSVAVQHQEQNLRRCIAYYEPMSHHKTVSFFYYQLAQLAQQQDQLTLAVDLCTRGMQVDSGRSTDGYCQCRTLKQDITKVNVTAKAPGHLLPNRYQQCLVNSTNASTLYLRIIEYKEIDLWSSKALSQLTRQRALQQWQQPTNDSNDYHSVTTAINLPPMPCGHYRLLVSAKADFSAEAAVAQVELNYAELAFVPSGHDALQGMLVSRLNGAPIASQELTLTEIIIRDSEGASYTITTDDLGRYDFSKLVGYHRGYATYRFSTNYQGCVIGEVSSLFRDIDLHQIISEKTWMLLDRPIYRLGDTVECVVTLTRVKDNSKGVTLNHTPVRLILISPRQDKLDTVTLETDDYGRAVARFVLPDKGLNGNYGIRCQLKPGRKWQNSNYCVVPVEAYRQPKFSVSMPDDDNHYQLEQPMTLRGLALSYSQVPISGAMVQYRVERSVFMPWYRYFGPTVAPVTVSSGNTMTDADGGFSINFTPQPDSTVASHNHPCFRYKVLVDVTDINGETHSAERLFTIGYRSSYITLCSTAVQAFDTLRFNHLNLDGKPVAGTVDVKVELLRNGEQQWLTDKLTQGAYQSLSEAEFRQRYPLLHYRPTDSDPEHWAVDGTVQFSTTVNTTTEGACAVALPSLPSGTYRVTLVADGESYIDYITSCRPDMTQSPKALLWSDVNSNQLEVGDTLCLRVGSRMKAIAVGYVIAKGDTVLCHDTVWLNDEVRQLYFPIDWTMRGGITVSVSALYDNIADCQQYSIAVPFTDRQLQVDFHTFRDKIAPGSSETWTLKVLSQQGRPMNAAMVATMYDAALTQFASLSWSLSPWNRNGVYTLYSYPETALSGYSFPVRTKSCNSKEHNTPIMLQSVVFPGFYMFNRAYRSAPLALDAVAYGMMPGAAVEGLAESDEEEMDVPIGKAAANAASVAEASSTPASVEEPPVIQLRTDMNPLAFFAPRLVTDAATGQVTITFTVPDLLTTWNVHALAWTPDLKVGSAVQQVVTQRPLMVVPNVPRFLRQGDQTVIAAKVSNMSDSAQEVTVRLEMSDMQQDSTFFVQTQSLRLMAGGSNSVDFAFKVPQHVSTARYKITVVGQHGSDGEQALVPVLSNRQFMTTSMAMYINGSGQKQYNFTALLNNHSTTLQHEGLILEWTNNPLWYAIMAMPYLQQQRSPSHIYMANSYYVNSIGLKLMEDYPVIEQQLQQWQQTDTDALLSPLAKHEDLTQTLLEETPWLVEATTQTQQQRQLAQFFQRESLGQSLSDLQEQLVKGQLSNGAWCWISGGRYASLYVTELILQRMGDLQRRGIALSRTMEQCVDKALAYVDQEKERDQRYLKWGNSEAVDIYYLYMCSFYEGHSFHGHGAAYRYYYNNALKYYNQYSDLYTRAQLALVFYRHGDKDVARTIAQTLKESALYSDEMGMYWRDNVGSYWWYRRPIETQALLIEVMDEVLNDQTSVALMQQWLLKQKQTTHWDNDVATTQAIAALLAGNGATQLVDGSQHPVQITIGSDTLRDSMQSGTGYLMHRWPGASVSADMGHVTLQKETDGIAWGALYWQYFEDLDKVAYSPMGIKMQKSLYRVEADGSLSALHDTVQVGDRIRVRILIDCDRNLEYLQLKDLRAAGLEPVSTTSGWARNGALYYYADMHDASMLCYIERLDKGKYVVEYDVWATCAGDYAMGFASMQCLYAPEFRCHTEGRRLTIVRP